MGKENSITLNMPQVGGKFTFDLDKLKEGRSTDKRGYATTAFVTDSGDSACIPGADGKPVEITLLLVDKSKKSKGEGKSPKSML